MPSKLYRELFWEVSFQDIKVKIRLYLGEAQAKIIQDFEVFSKVATLALGGKPTNRPQDDPNIKKPQSASELRQVFGKMFG